MSHAIDALIALTVLLAVGTAIGALIPGDWLRVLCGGEEG